MSKYADLVLQSNCVFTAAGEEPFAGFVAVAGSKILCVGHGAPDGAILGPNTRVLSLGDRTISPGFSDVHCFFTGYSVGFLGADLSACKTEAELEQAGELTLRVNFMSQPVAEEADLAYGRAMREKFTGEFVRFSGYNQMTDGSISQLCGDLKQPYNCADTCCAQNIDWDSLARQTRAADAEGFRFSLHAQGDAAIAKVLDIYETCRRDAQGRVINRHAITDLEFSDPRDLERMGAMGVIAEIYPQIQSIADREGKLAMISEKIGMERGRYYWNRRKMADSGVLLSCGTDLPLLIDDIPESVYHAVGGYFPEGGEPFNKQNMLTVTELLTAWTRGGAYNLSCEDTLGTLEPGKKADIAVLSGTLFTTAVEDSRNLKVDLTLVNGSIVYNAL